NDAAMVLRRLVRSLPTRKGVLGVATCDKGLPAMMMTLAAMRALPVVLVPGGVTLPPRDGEDAGKVQSIGARFAHGELTLEQAQDLGCRACGSPGGGCQFLGTAATSQVIGEAPGRVLDGWETSARRHGLRERLRRADGIAPEDVIMDPDRARSRGLTSTVTFPRGNLAPEGSVIKSTAIDPSVGDADGVYRKTGPARVFVREKDAIAAIKNPGAGGIKAGDVLVLICRGPIGAGMEEIYQI